MIPKKTYKIAVNFSKLLISYLAVGALLLLLIMLILNGKVPNFEMICSVYSIIFFVGFMALGGVGLHFVHMCGCPFCRAGKHIVRDDKYDAELKKAGKAGEFTLSALRKAHLYQIRQRGR